MDAEKRLDKLQHSFMIKILNKLSIEVMYWKIIKATFENPTANIIHNSKNLKYFPLKSGTRQDAPFSITSIQHNYGSTG